MSEARPADEQAPFGTLHLEHASTVDRVADELRRAVFDGELESGTPLREVAIAASLGVSRPTVREALTVLVAEGLATREPNRGVSVATPGGRLRARRLRGPAGARGRRHPALARGRPTSSAALVRTHARRLHRARSTPTRRTRSSTSGTSPSTSRWSASPARPGWSRCRRTSSSSSSSRWPRSTGSGATPTTRPTRHAALVRLLERDDIDGGVRVPGRSTSPTPRTRSSRRWTSTAWRPDRLTALVRFLSWLVTTAVALAVATPAHRRHLLHGPVHGQEEIEHKLVPLLLVVADPRRGHVVREADPHDPVDPVHHHHARAVPARDQRRAAHVHQLAGRQARHRLPRRRLLAGGRRRHRDHGGHLDRRQRDRGHRR